MNQDPHQITCPFCWQRLDILVDPSVSEQSYTEDCQVCCHPILITIRISLTGDVELSVEAE